MLQSGISSRAILDFYKRFEEIGGENHGLIITVNGERVYEEYCYPYGKDTPQNMFSCTKTLVSLAVGFAIEDGLLSLDTKIYPYFKDYPHKPNKAIEELTVEDLLKMNSGKKFSFLQDMTADHAALFMKAGFASKKAFKYSNNDSHIIAALVTKVVGKPLDDYLDEKLFKPLSIKKPFWDKNALGVCVGGSGAFMTCSDLATIGECVAAGGMKNGVQIIPRDYLEKATKKQITPSKTYHADGFGYYFWQDGETYRLEGLFGQFSVVIPEKNTVVTVTSMHPSDNLIAVTIQDVLVKNLFNESQDFDALDAYLIERDRKLRAISRPIDVSVVKNAVGEYKRKGKISSITKAFTGFTNGLIANSIHSSYPSRPSDSIDDLRFNFTEEEVEISWREGEVNVKFSSGLDGKPRVTPIKYLQWTYDVWSYSYFEKGKLHVVTRPLNTISTKEFIFSFRGNTVKMTTKTLPDFVVFCGYNSVAGGTIPSLPVVTPILVSFVKAACSITKIPVKIKKK